MSEIVAFNLGARLAGEGRPIVAFLNRSARKVRGDLTPDELLAFARLGRERFAYWVVRGHDDATLVP